ncbi:MAG: hypothetical protein HC920_05635 [Oscillatoriales cyanobacterium SM2_3_0]|nr:hypothetical protein [Oscillatoriales cyanobacterium SM2_3_0]
MSAIPGLETLYFQLETAVTQASTLDLKLRVAAEGIIQIAIAISDHSEFLFDSLKIPVVSPDGFQELIQQSRVVDLDPWVERHCFTHHRSSPKTLPVALMDDQQLIDFLQISQQDLAPLADHSNQSLAIEISKIASEENITQWSQHVINYLSQQDSSMSLLKLSEKLDMPLVEVWLGVLLSESVDLVQVSSQTGGQDSHDFYQTERIFVAPLETFSGDGRI